MEGKALTWFHWWQENATFQSWGLLKNTIIKRFHPELIQNPFELLLGLCQGGSVREFREKFEMYSSLLNVNERISSESSLTISKMR